MRNAVSRVVASIPTHITPMLLERRTTSIAESEPNQRPPYLLAAAVSSVFLRTSSAKYPGECRAPSE